MKAMWTVARRDVRALFDHPTGYILLVVFLGINNFLFFRSAYLIGVASMRFMMDLLPWLFLFFVPAVTMRSLAEETRTGTLEIVLAQPISEFSYLMGKYLAQLIFVWTALAVTLPIPLALSFGADLQVGVIFAQYLGAALLAAGFAAVGVWASSLTPNQITAFIIGVAVMFLLVLVGLDPLIVGLPPTLGAIAARMGVLSHFGNIGRGVIDLRDAIYFVTMAAAFLSLAYLSVMSRKLAPAGAALQRLRGGILMAVAIAVVINLFGSKIGGRLDLTPGNAYTLSGTTRDLARDLEDLVTIRFYASRDLPSELQLHKRDIDDLLRDYRSAAGGNIRLIELDPADPEVAQEAQSYGIPPIQFNVVGEGEFQVKEGYLGLVIQYADGTERIPFIQQADDLEYRISSFIRGLTATDLSAVGLLVAPSSPADRREFQSLRAQLAETYGVTDLALPLDSTFDVGFAVVVVAGDLDSLSDADVSRFQEYLAGGGAAFIASRGMFLNIQPQQQPLAFADEVAVNRLMEAYGVSITSDMVYDLASNERISFNTAAGRRAEMSYPFWTRPLSTKAAVLNQELEGLFMPWPSTIDTSGAAPGTITPLFVTSRAGGVEAGTSFLQPGREFNQTDLGMRLVAVQVNPLASDSTDARGRLVVAGDADFISDSYAANAPENMAFFLNAIDWLAQDESLMQIRSKNRRPPQLVFTSELKRDAVKYANLAGVPILVVLAAVLRLMRRRRLMKAEFRREAA